VVNSVNPVNSVNSGSDNVQTIKQHKAKLKVNFKLEKKYTNLLKLGLKKAYNSK